MSKGKKILLGIFIVIVGFMALSVLAYESLSDEEKEQLETEREDKERDERGLNLKTAKDIDPSKLSNEQYRINAERILSEYVFEYQGKDKSGSNLKEAFVEFLGCGSSAEYTVEIDRWTEDDLIVLEVGTDLIMCENFVYLDFVYHPSSTDNLRLSKDQTWIELSESIINYLDINP